MQDGPMRPANRMNDNEGITFSNFMTLVLMFAMLAGADCFAIWIMK